MKTIELLRGSFAILGGSFDPVHNGHIYLAREVLSRTPVSKVLMVPAYKHNFKKKDIFLDYDLRLELLKKAIQNCNLLKFVSQPAEEFSTPIEVWDSERGESGYTSDLIRKLKGELPEQNFAFIIGADNLEKLHLWHDYKWLKENVIFIVLPRPNAIIPCNILSEITHHFLDIPMCEISSTQIRSRIARGQSITGMVDPTIEEEIIRSFNE